jgi:hypothetical protein
MAHGVTDMDMFSLWKRILSLWRRIEPWIARLELSNFLADKTGLGVFALKFGLPAVNGVAAMILAAIGHAPLYVIFLALLSGVVLTLSGIRQFQSMFITRTQQVVLQPSPTKSTKERSVSRPAVQTTSKAPERIVTLDHDKKTAGIGQAIIVGAAIIIGVIGNTVYQNWTVSRAQFDRTILTLLQIARPPIPEKNQFLGFNVIWLTTGPLSIRGVMHLYNFDSFSHILSPAEEDTQFVELDKRMPQEEPLLGELPPNKVAYATFQDERFTPADWQAVLDGKIVIYMFAEFRYLVEGTTKTTELCLFIDKYYPAIHNCLGHNQTFVSR